jgi:hypothetical protein
MSCRVAFAAFSKEERMSRIRFIVARRAGCFGAIAAIVFCSVTAANAQESDERRGPAGRIDFSQADLPPATVEVDLSQGMFHDLFGIGDAAVAGMAETLLQSSENGESEGTRMAAQQLAAARQIMQLAAEVVREVRVRVYSDLPESSARPEAITSKFDEQLRDGDWDNVVRVREDDNTVRVSLLRENGAVRGIFVIVAERSELVLANVVCDVSPENAKKLTAAAARIGLENGLAQMIEAKMREMHHRLPPPAEAPGKAQK